MLVLSLHGQLAPAAWAAARAAPGLAVGYLQTPGGALPGSLSRDVADLRERGLLRGHVTAGAAYGGESEAISVAGGIDAAPSLGWEAVIAGPGPGILGSGSELGHGGMAALDTAHAALALGCPTVLAPRLSSGDERSRHRGLSHHTATVLGLLLAGVRVAVPAGSGDEEWRQPPRRGVRRAPRRVGGRGASGRVRGVGAAEHHDGTGAGGRSRLLRRGSGGRRRPGVPRPAAGLGFAQERTGKGLMMEAKPNRPGGQA